MKVIMNEKWIIIGGKDKEKSQKLLHEKCNLLKIEKIFIIFYSLSRITGL